MALTTFYTPRYRAPGINGDPLPNAYLEFFEAGTSTPLAVYADVDGDTALGVTVTADANGLFPEMFMLPQAYDIDLYDENDDLIWSAVNWFPPSAASAGALDISATAGQALDANDLCYVSDGSGALNAGQLYKADSDLSYASLTPMCYFAVSAVAMGESGTFRQAGSLSGFSGLTPGEKYYASATSGAITATAPANRRFVGQAQSTTVLLCETNPPVYEEIAYVVDDRVKSINDFRLSLTSGTPVTTSDVTAAGTLYLALYTGNQIALYSGTQWVVMTLAQLSVAAPAAANQMYDVFVDYNDGSPQLVLLAWTNDTTRATALTRQDGVYVKTGDTQQRYVGSVRTRTASQFNDAAAFRHVWNYYNRVVRSCAGTFVTGTYNYTTDTYQEFNGGTGVQLDIVVGVSEDALEATAVNWAYNGGATVTAQISIGQDSTTAAMTGTIGGASQVGALQQLSAFVRSIPAVGRHFYAAIERSGAAGTTAWGPNANAMGAGGNAGIIGTWKA